MKSMYPKRIVQSVCLTICMLLCHTHTKAAISIDSIKTTVSRCPNNGTITVFATSSQTSILYTILAGPETRPYQSGNLFSGLFPGNYLIATTNIAGEKDTQTVVIKGSNYVEPDFTTNIVNGKCGDVFVIGTPSIGSRKPFTWTLTDVNTGISISQTSDTFIIRNKGTYNLRMYDSCQNFVTRTFVINYIDTIFAQVGSAEVNKFACDTMRLRFSFITSTPYAQLYYFKLTMYNLNDTIVKMVKPFIDGSYYSITEIFPNIDYGDNFRFMLEDSCGRKIISNAIKIPEFVFTIRNYYNPYTSCIGEVGAFLDIYHNIFPSYGQFLYYKVIPKYPLTFTVKDIDSNKVVQTTTITGGLCNITPKVGGRKYLITIKDGCGDVYAFDTIWPLPKRCKGNNVIYFGCIDSTASVALNFTDFGPDLKVEITDGPKYLHSTKPYYNYFDSITYPKLFTNLSNATSTISGVTIINYKYLQLKNLPEGTYHYKAYDADTCGNIIIDSFTIKKNNLTIMNHSTYFKKGCLGQNILYFKSNSVRTNKLYKVINRVTGNTIFNGYKNNSFDSITSVPSGKYAVYLDYSVNGKPLNNNITNCWFIIDTIEIPPYERPKTASVSTIYCNGNRYAELHPDSTKGIAPYQYEVISGPKLYPLQSSNVFTFIPVGNYVSRIVDACGNSNILDFGVDTLIFPPIRKIGSSCLNGSFVLFYESSPFYSYQWTKPDGTAYNGDSMRINGVTYTDTGWYQIKRFVNINDCKDTASTSYHLQSTAEYTRIETICEGNSIQIGTNIYAESGNYSDTITSIDCDTIYNLRLTVLPKARVNIDTTICIGKVIIIGNKTYTKAGTYIDKATAINGCDSITTININTTQVINLQLTASKTSVFPGDTVQLNAISNQPITYYDWSSTATFDINNIPNPIATIKQPSWIHLNTIGNIPIGGCRRSDSIFIDILKTCTVDNLFIPNSFSPNGDGINDVFKARTNAIQSGKLVVYNRWGNKVFESTDLTKGWDGTYKGIAEPIDAFAYYFEGICLNGESITLKGNVTIIR